MKVERDFANKLLKRREVEVLVEDTSNPGVAKAKELVAKEFKSSPDCVAVQAVRGHFGRNEFLIEASVYDSKESLESTEKKPKPKKGGSN